MKGPKAGASSPTGMSPPELTDAMIEAGVHALREHEALDPCQMNFGHDALAVTADDRAAVRDVFLAVYGLLHPIPG